MKTFIIVNTSFEALHHWPDCRIPGVEFLRNKHRHMFHVKVKALVFHDDRDIEFINFKSELDRFLNAFYDKQDLGQKSCEMICKEIQKKFPHLTYVRVMEDNENGAELII